EDPGADLHVERGRGAERREADVGAEAPTRPDARYEGSADLARGVRPDGLATLEDRRSRSRDLGPQELEQIPRAVRGAWADGVLEELGENGRIVPWHVERDEHLRLEHPSVAQGARPHGERDRQRPEID